MFTAARWRLTLWFLAVFALILALIGVAVYLTARAVLFDGLDDDLRARAGRETRRLGATLLQGSRRDQPLQGLTLGPAFTAGGYFYALTDGDGNLLASTANVDPSGLADAEAIQAALTEGATFVSTDSSTGEQLRVYLVPLGLRQPQWVLQVGRSMEPELAALRRLVFILAAGGGAGLILALVGGFFLAGRALTPIRSAMERQRAFVADASHELRTPLSLIRANAELLKRHPQKPLQDNLASLEDIIQETDRLGTLVGQMLTLALADAERAPFNFAPLELRTLVEEVGRQIRPLAEAKGLALTVETDGPVVVRGDAVRLRELLLILLDNAIKFTDPGGAVRLTLATDVKKATLRVIDSGRGIPPQALLHVFDRFYRVDKARSREEGGAGLGLAIAKWIVDQHHGSIGAASQPGQGTTMTVELPTASPP